ncbi:MAG: hypothetical protein EXS46_04035 [Candidatus Taylorbacteria bacterium]|nr:hypothetical protein [Candidatus Taylorbacteria bacterium]
METNVPFINIEYIFTKIYDFLIYIKNVILTGSFNAGSGTSDYAGSFGHILALVVTILTFACIAFIIWGIYVRIRIFEIDEALDGEYKGHFIKPETKLERVNMRWQNILSHFNSTNPNDWRAAIIDADAMLDEVVTSLGYTGEGLGAKLTSIRINDFPTLQSAWEAHKMRNIIAHEGANYNLTERQKEITRRYFETVFRDAGVI